MSFLEVFISSLIVANALLGFLVFRANRQISVNRQFVFLTINLSLWMLLMNLAFRSQTTDVAVFWIRMASAVGAFVPVCSYLLFLGITNQKDSLKQLLMKGKWAAIAGFVISVFSWSPLYLEGARFPTEGGLDELPIPVPGAIYHILSLYYIVMMSWLLVGSIRKSRRTNDEAERMVYQFVAAGLIVLLVLGAASVVVLPAIRDDAESVPYSFLAILLMNVVIAYGIAAKQLMNVGVIARRLVSHSLQLLYVAGLYAGIFLILFRWNVNLAHVASAAGIWMVTSGNGWFFTTFLKRIHMFF